MHMDMFTVASAVYAHTYVRGGDWEGRFDGKGGGRRWWEQAQPAATLHNRLNGIAARHCMAQEPIFNAIKFCSAVVLSCRQWLIETILIHTYVHTYVSISWHKLCQLYRHGYGVALSRGGCDIVQVPNVGAIGIVCSYSHCTRQSCQLMLVVATARLKSEWLVLSMVYCWNLYAIIARSPSAATSAGGWGLSCTQWAFTTDYHTQGCSIQCTIWQIATLYKHVKNCNLFTLEWDQTICKYVLEYWRVIFKMDQCVCWIYGTGTLPHVRLPQWAICVCVLVMFLHSSLRPPSVHVWMQYIVL